MIANMIFIIFGALIGVSPIYGHEQVVSQSQTSNEQVMSKSLTSHEQDMNKS